MPAENEANSEDNPYESLGTTALNFNENDAAAEDLGFVETTVPSGPSPPPPPHPSFRGLHSLGVPDDLWRHHRDLSVEAMRQMDPTDPLHKAVPLPYCNAFCLDNNNGNSNNSNHRTGTTARSTFFGYPCSTFQVTSREDGHLYCVKRFDNVRSVSPRIAMTVTDWWRSVPTDHPGLVPFYHCFVAQRAVFFVHQYIPGARSLVEQQQRLVVTSNSNNLQQQQEQQQVRILPEPVLWSCLTQLVSAMRVVHSHNLAVRTLRWQHVLATLDAENTRLRLRLGSLGVVDALEFEARKHVADLQMEDVRDLGRLMLSLSTGTEVTASTNSDAHALHQCEQFLVQHYSQEWNSLILTLIRSTPQPPSLVDVSRVVAQRCGLEEQDAVYRALDRSERALATEYESGRALRLLLKLGFVNERPEFGLNRRWAQSGDCYVLTLFRDYVFHQADGVGNPVMDLGHVVTALNKLDAADEEQIALASRDGKTIIVVSYAEVARCLESAFHELCAGSVPPSMLRY